MMKLRLLTAALAATILLAGSVFAQTTPAPNKNDLSYALGYQTGLDLNEMGEPVDINTVIKALQDSYAKKDPAVPMAQLRTALEALQKRTSERNKAAYDKAAVDNKAKSDQFLAQNKTKAGVQALPGGIQYRVIEAGSGPKPTQASTVQLEFSGPFPLGQRPAEARAAQQIPSVKVSEIKMQGMRDVLTQMPAGAKWEIVLPSDKAYGNDPRSEFPPNLAVVFEIKLISVK
jgi:peptidylprolyl isomerase